MRVYVSSPNAAISPQILAYAEYRMFAALARYDAVRGAQVVLRADGRRRIRCSVTIELNSAAPAQASASGSHAVATIDRAAERVGKMMRSRFQPEIAAASY
jgi:ribosome-associated translation inhibitor RaiA